MNITEWLIDPVMVSKPDGIDYSTGKAVYGAPVEIRCRVEHTTKVVQDVEGREYVSSTNVVTDQPIGINDRLWLPGSDPLDVNLSEKPANVMTARTKYGDFQMWTVYL